MPSSVAKHSATVKHGSAPSGKWFHQNYAEWGKVRMMHLITNLAGRGWHIPKNVTARAEKYH